jgi:hypothetical protein
MKMNYVFSALLAVVIGIVSFAVESQAQQQPPLYIAVECMKATVPDYPGIETDVWQPMHQERVNQGAIYGWSLYFVMYGDRSKCDYYTVTSFLGDAQLNDTPDFEAVFRKVHPGRNFDKTMLATWESRRHVASELWESVDATEIGAHRFATVNRMKAIDPDAYERMESRVFKPGHEALVEGGHRAGWAMYRLLSPIGSSIPYDYSTVDFSNQLSPVPMAEAMLAAHPDRDLDAIQELLELREQVRSETWVRVAGTQAWKN